MKVEIIAGRSIDVALADVWRNLQQQNPDLVSPYFAPEFTTAVAKARDDVDIATIEEGGQVAAIFPFQRRRRSIGQPVGGYLSDYHGLICQRGFECDPTKLLRKSGLVVWDFGHLLASQTCFAPFHQSLRVSPVINLSEGYEVYVAERRASGTEQIKKCDALRRRLEREVGPLRFVIHSPDGSLLRHVLDWKSQQYLATGKRDLLSGWPRALLDEILIVQAEGFAGMLSLLYAGDRLIAGHMGMRSRLVWHYWFPAYDPEFARFSPGLLLLLKMAEHASGLGLRMLDLGMGMSLYKERLMNDSVSVASGSVTLPSLVSLGRTARRVFRGVVVRTPLAGPSRAVFRLLCRR